jgi:3-dehydroquinate synthase
LADPIVALDPPYPVRLRPDFPGAWRALRADHPDRRLFVVADRKVLRQQPHALAGLEPAEREAVVEIEGGERIKNLRHLEALVERALHHRVDRRSLVVAVGGGTVGDLVGFFAATYMRGVDWCPLATTVVSLADAAVGGKTGVNCQGLKNLVGAFHQPAGVYGALEALRTLPRRHRIAGLAEVVKCGVIADAALFQKLEEGAESLADPEAPLWGEILAASVAVKAAVVAEDPTERGQREILNYGHTLGHALEATVRPALHHGEAVALGMVAALRIARARSTGSDALLPRVENLLLRLGLPTSHRGIDVTSALEAVGYDKKVWDAQVRMVLTDAVGSATVGHAVDRSEMSRALHQMSA